VHASIRLLIAIVCSIYLVIAETQDRIIYSKILDSAYGSTPDQCQEESAVLMKLNNYEHAW
jgi:uncharacterized membrane protein